MSEYIKVTQAAGLYDALSYAEATVFYKERHIKLSYRNGRRQVMSDFVDNPEDAFDLLDQAIIELANDKKFRKMLVRVAKRYRTEHEIGDAINKAFDDNLSDILNSVYDDFDSTTRQARALHLLSTLTPLIDQVNESLDESGLFEEKAINLSSNESKLIGNTVYAAVVEIAYDGAISFEVVEGIFTNKEAAENYARKVKNEEDGIDSFAREFKLQ